MGIELNLEMILQKFTELAGDNDIADKIRGETLWFFVDGKCQ